MEKKVSIKEKFSKKLILDVQKLVEKGASKEKIGLRGPMPPGSHFFSSFGCSGVPFTLRRVPSS